MKKRYVLAALGLSMILLAGCEKKDEKEANKPAEATTLSEEIPLVKLDIEPSEYIKLGQYKGLVIEKGAAKEITDDMVEEQLKLYNEDIVEYEEVKDRSEVQAGDVVKVDIKCMVGKQEDSSYAGEDIDFILGDEYSDWIQDVEIDYEAALIGKKVGDTAVIQFTFSPEYEYDNYAGKDAELQMKIKAIEKAKKLEIDDAWAKEYMGAESLQALKEDVKKQLQEEQAMNAEYDSEEALWDQIIANCTQIKDFPEDKVNQEVEAQHFMIDDFIQFEEMTEEEYCKQYLGGLSVEDYVKKNLIRECAQKLIAEAEGIAVTHKDVTESLEQFVDGDDYATIDDVIDAMGGEDTVKEELLATKIDDLLMKENTLK